MEKSLRRRPRQFEAYVLLFRAICVRLSKYCPGVTRLKSRSLSLNSTRFWFLMTDGIIESQDVRRFARKLLEYGLHGIACVISIFGYLEEKPSDCNITVGLSVFAVSPHTAFFVYPCGIREDLCSADQRMLLSFAPAWPFQSNPGSQHILGRFAPDVF